MEKVKQVKLGRTNIVCGELGMGCEGFSKVTEKEARDMIDLALSKGMNFIDLYASNPTVRENIGKAINGRREEIYIQGHLCTIWKDNQYKRTSGSAKCCILFQTMGHMGKRWSEEE